MKFRSFYRKIRTKSSLLPVTSGQSCPNCWGVQHWCNTYLSVPYRSKQGFIRKFVEKYLEGVRS